MMDEKIRSSFIPIILQNLFYSVSVKKREDIFGVGRLVTNKAVVSFLLSDHFLVYASRRFISNLGIMPRPTRLQLTLPARSVHSLGFNEIILESNTKKIECEINIVDGPPHTTLKIMKDKKSIKECTTKEKVPFYLDKNFYGTYTFEIVEQGKIWYSGNVTFSKRMNSDCHKKLSQRILLFKRIIDIMFGVFLLLPSLVVTSVLYLAIRATHKGPVFYKKMAPTVGGERVTYFKLTTMSVPKSISLLGRPAKENKQYITPLGRIIRPPGLDELPQIWNILKGGLSLIGPRTSPIDAPHYYSLYGKEFVQKLITQTVVIKPGLTSLADAVKGRGLRGIDIISRSKYNEYYLDKWSLVLELKIIFYTLLSLVHLEGIEEYYE